LRAVLDATLVSMKAVLEKRDRLHQKLSQAEAGAVEA
jgi:hypothetical protein